MNPWIPLCNIPPSRGRARLHLAVYLGYRLPSQTNTSLFCTLCPYSCAPRKNFLVGHPSSNFSGPSMLNLGVLWRPASGKKLQLVDMSILSILLSSWAGVSHTHPLKRPTSSSVNPKPGTSSLGYVPYVLYFKLLPFIVITYLCIYSSLDLN